jgi:hypothetical protein
MPRTLSRECPNKNCRRDLIGWAVLSSPLITRNNEGTVVWGGWGNTPALSGRTRDARLRQPIFSGSTKGDLAFDPSPLILNIGHAVDVVVAMIFNRLHLLWWKEKDLLMEWKNFEDCAHQEPPAHYCQLHPLKIDLQALLKRGQTIRGGGIRWC